MTRRTRSDDVEVNLNTGAALFRADLFDFSDPI